MKKLFALMMAVALLMSCCAAMAEEGTDSVPMPEEAAAFEGIWACDRVNLEMTWEEEGFRVMITWGSSATESTMWEYNCFYNENDHSVASVLNNGIKTDMVFDENGELKSSTPVYEDGEAVFTLDEDNHLIWKDAKEDAGKDLHFEYVGPIPPIDQDA